MGRDAVLRGGPQVWRGDSGSLRELHPCVCRWGRGAQRGCCGAPGARLPPTGRCLGRTAMSPGRSVWRPPHHGAPQGLWELPSSCPARGASVAPVDPQRKSRTFSWVLTGRAPGLSPPTLPTVPSPGPPPAPCPSHPQCPSPPGWLRPPRCSRRRRRRQEHCPPVLSRASLRPSRGRAAGSSAGDTSRPLSVGPALGGEARVTPGPGPHAAAEDGETAAAPR